MTEMSLRNAELTRQNEEKDEEIETLSKLTQSSAADEIAALQKKVQHLKESCKNVRHAAVMCCLLE